MTKNQIVLAMCILMVHAVSAHPRVTDSNAKFAKSTSNNLKISVQTKFNLISIEGRPLEGNLKTFSDQFKSKNKTEFVSPTQQPKPMIDGKAIDLTAFYQKCVSQLNLPDEKKAFRDTVNILFYLDATGKINSGYAMSDEKKSAYINILKQSDDIKKWTPAYFDKTPGEVGGLIQIVISDSEIK